MMSRSGRRRNRDRMLDDTDRVSLVLQVDIAAECQDRVQVPEGKVDFRPRIRADYKHMMRLTVAV
jgi:hypothetical protein